MATIPTYERQVGVEDVGQPTPQIQPITEAASGVNVAEAGARLGQTVEHGFTDMGHLIAYKAHIESQERAYDLGAKAASEIQDKLYGDNGLMTRQGAQAHGILAGDIGADMPGQQRTKYKDSFVSFSEDLKSKYLKEAGSPTTQKMLMRYLDSHVTIARSAVAKHEAEQGRVAYQNAVESQVQALMDTGASARSLDDLHKVMDSGTELRVGLAAKRGADDAILEAVKYKTADEFAETAVRANLERDPQASQDILNGVKDRLSNVGQANLQTLVDGKMLELRRGAVWDQVKHFTHDDGTIDVSKAEGMASKLIDTDQIPPGQRDHIMQFVKQQAAVSDAALRDHREAQDRSFYNDALKARNNGLPFEKAEEILFKQKGYGFDAKDREDKRDQLLALYMKDPSFMNKAMEHQTPEQKMAWQEVEDMAASKYPTKKGGVVLPGDTQPVNAANSFVNEMKQQLMGESADRIRTVARERLKDVVVQEHWYGNTKQPVWQLDRDVRLMQDQKRSLLETRYGNDLVNQAHSYLVNQGSSNPTPEEIRTLLERMPHGR